MISIRSLGFKYERSVFHGLSFDFEPGAFYVLRGANGVGKTTLARVMLGLLKPCAGTVERPRRCVMSYLPDSNGIYSELTVLQNLRFRLALYGVGPEDARKSIGAWLDGLGLAEYENTRAGELSLGTRKKCAIACACAVPSDFLVLDEPLNALDEDACEAFYALTPRLAAGGRIVLCISHSFDGSACRRLELTCDSLVEVS